jgi:hypothetical protein
VPYFDFIWTDEIIDHIGQHGVSQDDFEEVVCHPKRKGASRSFGRQSATGYTIDGRYIMVVYEQVDFATVVPVTAYEIPEPR